MSKSLKNKKVFVGMSGGVDSSVSAALLKDKGFNVTGVFIKTWHPDFLPCNWREERRDAMRVAAKLGIKFMTLDLEKEYKKKVADYLIKEYKAGRTPNPDIMCNKQIKFGSFLKFALKSGADYVATGHYAKLKELAPSLSRGEVEKSKLKISKASSNKPKQYLLYAGDDERKDQSYFLYTLTQKQLSKVLFPVGNLQKSETRRLAKKYGLSTASKKDSQGICFLGNISMKDFLSHFIKQTKGKVLNTEGEMVGFHSGALFFTVGERHGFTVTKKTTNDQAFYVLSKNIKNNTITVGNQSIVKSLAQSQIKLKSLTFTANFVKAGDKISARVRYRQSLQKCLIKQIDKNKAIVEFAEPQTVASGQSVVFYKNKQCLGGGVIV